MPKVLFRMHGNTSMKMDVGHWLYRDIIPATETGT